MLVFGCDELNVLQIGRFSGLLIFHSQAKAEANLKMQIISDYLMRINCTEDAEP